ncbi:MAG: hypothetical protein UX71_C0002G0269 [Parcubacteria group bacterium GW2011_GWA1_47_10]|nr:MAG: hypothetical protein UX71_C0002G0269 [Parcubacteria group bacterium GW2011_GWA1_47_10]
MISRMPSELTISSAINQYFCLSSAERQRAKPFQTRVQRTAAIMNMGFIWAQLVIMFMDSSVMPQLYPIRKDTSNGTVLYSSK